MASPVHAVLCALIATGFWTVVGAALARHVLPRSLALGAAPVIGWGVCNAVALPIFVLIGFYQATVLGVSTLGLAIAAASLMVRSPADTEPMPTIPPWAFAAAAVLALVPALAIVPKFSGGGVYLADPIFDHAKIAIIDGMTRQGLPPINPVFGAPGEAGRLAYYYLWHFGAAQLALALGVSGWEADIGCTWFTAFASLTLMMAIAVWLGRRSGAAILVVVLAAGASLHRTLGVLLDAFSRSPFLGPQTGFSGWLFQSAWVPQHLMAASCVVTAMVLLAQQSERQTWLRLATLVLVVTAGFESSTYVGGVTFAVAALAAAPFLFAGVETGQRLRFALGLAIAAVLVAGLATPFILAQFGTVAARDGGSPIVLDHFKVLGALFPLPVRRVLDLPAYWLILLPIEFPATYIAGTIALIAAFRSTAKGVHRTAIAAFIVLAAAGLSVSWLLVSTLGDVNDLRLRAILPAVLVLIVATAAGMMRASCRVLIGAIALTGLIFSLPNGAEIVQVDIAGRPQPDAAIFAKAPELWAAVRRYAGSDSRVANNPLFLRDLTPWPANMSWALLANRSSCFAGREMTLAFAPLPPARREAINAQFIRVFAGQGGPDDVAAMATEFGCEVVVIVPQDGAWDHDPFAASSDYRLAEFRADQWRIYIRASDAPAAN
jgi:hypothetical protein